MNRRAQKIALAATLLLYLAYFISTLAQQEFLIRLFSPMTLVGAILIFVFCIPKIAGFRAPAQCIALGIAFWALSDGIRLVQHDELSNLLRTLYLFPNYCFGISIVLYVHKKLKRRELSQLVINTFTLSMIGFILLQKLVGLLSPSGGLDWLAHIRSLMYVFINFFILVLSVHVIYMVGSESLWRGTNLVPLSILGYVLFDFIYIYTEIIGQEPENIYSDLVYVMFMVLMAFGVYSQAMHHYEYRLKERDYSEHASRRSILFAGLAIVAALAAFLFSWLSQNEFALIVLALMSYMIMYSTLRGSALNERLLSQQTELNAALEEQVQEKTRNLQTANKDLERLSSTDMLTGLYNRRYASAYLAKLDRDAEKYGSGYAVFSIDLNHFKPINDTYGHEMGDKVLVEFGLRMRSMTDRFVAFRMGGDEFMIVFTHVRNRDEVERAAEDIQSMLRRPVILDTYIFNLSGSIGIAIYPGDAVDADELLQYSDAAMYAVKRSARRDDYRFFDRGLIATVEQRRTLETYLKDADPKRDFKLLMQPQYVYQEEEIYGIEIFPHLKDESIVHTAAELISTAEECGLMRPLGIWIAENAIARTRQMSERCGRQLCVTINLAPLQLLDADFIESLSRFTDQYNLLPHQLILDVSNEVMLGAAESARDTLRSLSRFGFILSLNDFGGGDISLSYIVDCGFSIIKLSRSLIAGAVEDAETRRIIKAVHAMAKEMVIEVMAVGVETKQQAELLHDLGVEKMQGFYFAHPMEQPDFEKLLHI